MGRPSERLDHDGIDSRMRRRLVATLAIAVCIIGTSIARADNDCDRRFCPVVETASGAITATYVSTDSGSSWVASNVAPVAHPYTYRLIDPCVVNDATTGSCQGQDFRDCPTPVDRVADFRLIQQQRLVLPDGSTVDGFDPSGSLPGTPVGPWVSLGRFCVDITALNPPPSPAEVYRYFQTLPLPDLPTQQQPPGNALAGLPVVFYTDGPTTQTFTVYI
jgi:hypothetical protein